MGMILDQYHVIEYRGLKRKISRKSGSCLALCKPLVSHRFTPPILNQRVKNPGLFNPFTPRVSYRDIQVILTSETVDEML